jgi:LacI family transcriptional regulator
MASEPDVRPESVVGVRDIARRLGVSIGTVDRALHGKPDVKPDTRDRVLAIARTLGYRPNMAASYLRSGRQARVRVRLPDRASFFWETLRDGIREAAAPFAPSIGLEFGTYADGGDPLASLRPPTFDRSTAGLIVAAGESAPLTLPPEDVSSRTMPVVCVADGASNDSRILSVYVDPFSVGALAGELIGRFVPGGGEVALVTCVGASRGDAEQTSGFISSLSAFTTRLKLAAVIKSHADERETQKRVREVLRAHPRLKGLFVSSGQPLPVLTAARHEGRLAGLAVVTTDLSPELFDWIRTGSVAATIYQRPLTQGHAAFQLLYRYLQTRTLPTPQRQVIAPYAVMSSNLHIVLQRLDIARAASLAHEHRAAAPGS